MEFGSDHSMMSIGQLMMAIGQWSYLYFLVTILIHIAFSAATFNDARQLRNKGEQLALVGPVLWSVAVLVGGVFVALAYWVMHHSTLKQ